MDPRERARLLDGGLELTDEVRALRSHEDDFDMVVEIAVGDDPQPWAQAGATWMLTGFGRQPRLTEVRAAIDAGDS